MKNRIISFILSVCMLLGLVNMPLVASAESYSGTSGDITWSLDSETGVLTISGSGAIPYSAWGQYQSQIVSVVIEDGITSIGSGSFAGHSALKSVSIPDSVTSLGTFAFEYCTAMVDAKIGSGTER